jgi:hypothetical protein
MKNFFCGISLITLILIAESCSSLVENKPLKFNHKNEQFFNILLPEGFEIDRTTTMEDFEVFTVAKRGDPMVCIYVGNQPKFPRAQANTLQNKTTLRTEDTEIVSTWKGSRLINREILIKLKTNKQWPKFVHIWVPESSISKIDFADRILSSISTTPTGN